MKPLQHALGRQRRHGRLKVGKRLDQPFSEAVKLGVTFADVHAGALHPHPALAFPSFLLPGPQGKKKEKGETERVKQPVKET